MYNDAMLKRNRLIGSALTDKQFVKSDCWWSSVVTSIWG